MVNLEDLAEKAVEAFEELKKGNYNILDGVYSRFNVVLNDALEERGITDDSDISGFCVNRIKHLERTENQDLDEYFVMYLAINGAIGGYLHKDEQPEPPKQFSITPDLTYEQLWKQCYELGEQERIRKVTRALDEFYTPTTSAEAPDGGQIL
jgi:hypothetical protein